MRVYTHAACLLHDPGAGHAAVFDADIAHLETQLDGFNADLPPLKDFILPGGGEAAARCHVARTVVRRAERETVALSRAESFATRVPSPRPVVPSSPVRV